MQATILFTLNFIQTRNSLAMFTLTRYFEAMMNQNDMHVENFRAYEVCEWKMRGMIRAGCASG